VKSHLKLLHQSYIQNFMEIKRSES